MADPAAVLGLSPLAGKSRFAPFSFRETDYLKTFTATGMRLIDAVKAPVQRLAHPDPDITGRSDSERHGALVQSVDGRSSRCTGRCS